MDTDEICQKRGSTKIRNTILLGAGMTAGDLDITIEEIENAIKTRVNPKFHELNIAALNEGKKLCK